MSKPKHSASREAVNTDHHSFLNTDRAAQNERLDAAGTAEAALADRPDFPYDPVGTERDELFARFLAERRKALAERVVCVDAALALVERFDWSVFPAKFDETTVPARKYSYLSKDYSGGANWGHTKNPKKLARYYRDFPDAGVGVPCWPINPVFDLEADTKEGHDKDGLAALAALEKQHGKLLKTMMFESPTGSVHRIYKWPALPEGTTIPSTSSEITNGVDVIAANHMFVAPPSLRPGKGVYRWLNNLAPANAPAWLIDLIVASVATNDAQGTEPDEQLVADNFDMLAYAVSVTPNDLPGWKAWKDRLLAFYNAVGGDEEALATIAHEFSARWTGAKGYDADYTDKTIREVCARPPRSSGSNAAGAGTVYQAANEASPDWRDKYERQSATNVGTMLAEGAAARGEGGEHKERKQQTPDNDEKIVSKDVEWVCAADVKMRHKVWVWKGHLLRGALELLTGIPGLGKSQTQCHFVACVTNSKLWPDGAAAIAPANVIMVTAEDALDTEVVPRLTAAGADLKRVFFLKCIKTDKKTKRQFLLGEDLVRLKQMVNAIGNVGLICIDPITAYMGGKVDSHKTTEVRSQLGPLKDFAEHINIAISAITHPPKHSSNRAIDHFIGSQAFIAAARIGHACFEEMVEDGEDGEKRPTGRVLFTNAKYNAYTKMPTLAFRIEGTSVPDEFGIPIETSYVVWDKEAVNISADQAIASSKPKPKRNAEREEASDRVVVWLRDTLKDGPREQTEIVKQASALGYSRKQLRTAREKLAITPVKTGFGHTGAWMWDLPRASNGIPLRYG